MTRSLFKLYLGSWWWTRRKSSFSSLVAMLASIATLLFLVHRLIPTTPTQVEHAESLVYEPMSTNHSRVKRLPQAIIIGARKCGTRALLKFLEINQLVRAAQNEIHFFDRPSRYKRGIDWYRDQMVESSKDEITIEKSPSYFVTNDVAAKIAAMNQTIKLIVILRNPVIRLISDFSQIVANKIELEATNETTVADIEEAWHEAAKVFESHLFRPDGSIKDSWRAIQIGMYSKHLESWLKVFNLQQMHFVDGEKLIKHPDQELRQVEKFLNLKPTIKQDDFVFDQKKGFFCMAISQYNNRTTIMKPKCLSKHKGRRHVIVSGNINQRLRQFYAPYNEYLFSIIGRRFDWTN